ncbi:MAG: polysaccharide biosynthesis tyrosine autokinase, partial [Candidatus Margulisiibacteriota bacterium]
KLNEIKIAEAMKTSGAKLVSPAVPPDDPIKPRKILNLVMGLIVGLMCGSGAAFLVEYFDVSIKSTEEAKQVTGLVALGVIPMTRRSKKDGPFEYLITDTDPKSPVSEAFRTLEVDIKFSSSEMRGKVVLFTSALQGEGKSSTVSNYAVIKAQSGKKTVLIDADMRKPMLDKLFSLERRKGLSDVLIGDIPVENVIQKTKIENLDIVTAGIIPPNPASLLESAQMKVMLDYLSSKYDAILIDSPPLVGLPDALHLCAIADGVVLVIACGKSNRPIVKEARDILENSKAKMLGFVLTMFDRGKEIYSAYYSLDSYYSGHEKEK